MYKHYMYEHYNTKQYLFTHATSTRSGKNLLKHVR